MFYSLITIIRLIVSILLPVIASIILYLLNKNTKFGKISNNIKQVIIGVVYGLIAISATEWGVPLDGAVLNVRSASPLTAGLLFGWPSGLIAGLIGGVERYLTPAGDFTRVACTLGTIIAGIIGALVRKILMDNKKTSWFYGLLIGIVTEVIHMLMVFLNNSGDIQRAFRVVEICAIPMITSNGISVMLSIICITLLSLKSNKIILSSGKENISQIFQRWLFICVILAFVITMLSTNAFQKGMAKSTAIYTIESNLKDIEKDINDAANRNIIDTALNIVNEIQNWDTNTLNSVVKEHNLVDINLVDIYGYIVQSTYTNNIGKSIFAEDKNNTINFLGVEREFIQTKTKNINGEDLQLKIVTFSDVNGFVQLSFHIDEFYKNVDEQILHVAQYRHIGQNGFVIICDKEGIIISDNYGNIGRKINLNDDDSKIDVKPNMPFTTTLNDKKSLCIYEEMEHYNIFACMPEEEVYFTKKASVYMLAFMETIVFAFLFITIFVLIKRLVVSNIRKINNSLSLITDGDLNVTIDVRDNEEFASLSDDINCTVTTLKQYIDEAAARFDKDLEIAKQIQHSALPSVFPPYPARKDFSIYASMDAAKEVGGDFYDFYLVDENHLAFVIADVSGKGIPGAMFMMTSKTLIKSFAESGLAVNDVLTQVNNQLCQNNEAGMFVTAWMGILDLKSGIIKFANAGHNPPVIKHSDGSYEYLKCKANFVLAGMEGIRYAEQEVQISAGDEIYLYTDGVTEAHNLNKELFGEERLLDSLNSTKGFSVDDICKTVKKDVSNFVGEAEQFDDITMLCVRLNKVLEDSVYTVQPTMESVPDVAAFVEEEMEKLEVSPKISMKLMVAVDEIYSNIVRYSGANEARIEIGKHENSLRIRFIDDGKPYNPLEAKEPDITASVEDRKIGGLGIFMVRKMLDDVEYKNKDDKNILTLSKKLE